jgi:5-methylthioribose kinase
VKQVKAKIEKATRQSIALYKAIICFDGWNNAIHWLLMNVMLVCLVGDKFINLVDTIDHKKTKEYIVEQLKPYIKVVGLNNVIQICSNFISAIFGVVCELRALYLHMCKQGCCVHILDFFFEYWK